MRKDEQRRMARPAGCDRVHSALTHLVTALVAKIVSIHAHLQRNSSGQLLFVGLVRSQDRNSVNSWGERTRISASDVAILALKAVSLTASRNAALSRLTMSGEVRAGATMPYYSATS